MVIIDDSFQYLENLEVDKKKVLLSGIVESMEVTYVGGKRSSMDSFVCGLSLCSLTISLQDFQLPSISTITEMTCKVKADI